uniref:Adenylate kinase n=1 Tax=Globisporangium ultimum (strain ATCC 200006 / CBS 805.95 / DAOM BR144) TaxID=431595 RepID=K3WW11_GLOUD
MRVFISDLSSTFGEQLTTYCQEAEIQVVGAIASKSQQTLFKRKLQAYASSDTPDAVKEPVALLSDKPAWSKLIQKSTIVVVTSLANDTKLAMEMLKVHEKRDDNAGEDNENDEAVKRKFIAISSILTWSKNAAFAKEMSPEGPVPHHEDEFKTRKPARKYAELKTAETQILSANRSDELETYIVAAGLVYGGAQSNFHMVFRDAWMCPAKDLLVPSIPGGGVKDGMNLLPMISVYDLAMLTFRLASAPAPQPKNYLLAVDNASRSTTLRDVCCGLSILLGNGKVRDVAGNDEADELLVEEDDGLVAPLQLHLCFDTQEAVMNQLVAPDEWKHYETGLLGNLSFYVDDFIQAMDLRPLKTVVLGPPQVGKTRLSKKLARDYYLPYISMQSVVDEALPASEYEQQRQQAIEDGTEADENATPSAAPQDDGVDEELKKLRESLREWRSANKQLQELPEVLVIDLLRWKLCSASCRNQGYVLDGLPVTEEQASKVFAGLYKANGDGEDGNDGEGEGDNPADTESNDKAKGDDAEGAGEDGESGSLSLGKSRSKTLLAQLRPRRQVEAPNRVIVLHAPRALLESRAQQLSEEDAIATANTEAAFETRHAEFASQIEAIATFFETKTSVTAVDATNGIEVLELHLESEDAYRDAETFHDAIKNYLEQGGKTSKPPCNFHPTRDETRQMQREFEAKRRDDEVRARKQAAEQEEKDAVDQEARLAAERARLELIQREETELLEARAKPLRAYLMDTVLPALTEGMLEVVKVQPDDPIDYLAEFLFRKGREMDAAT